MSEQMKAREGGAVMGWRIVWCLVVGHMWRGGFYRAGRPEGLPPHVLKCSRCGREWW